MNLRLENLTQSYKSPSGEARTVIQIKEWSIEAGQQILIRGVSGSGKTTLFNMIAGLLRPTTGHVWMDDQSFYALPEALRDRVRARTIGYVFQNHYLVHSLTALENVVMPLAFDRVLPSSQWRSHAQELLEKVGIGEFSRYKPKQLSTGQRLRVAIARALANNPRIVLADEPTAALDEESGTTVMDFLQQTCHDNNAILIVASHDPALFQRFSTSADLKRGKLSWNKPERV